MRNVYNIKQSHYRNCQSVPLKYRVLRKWRKNRFFSSTKYVQNERKKKSKLTVTTIQNKDRLLRIEREKMAQLVAREGELREKKNKNSVFGKYLHGKYSLRVVVDVHISSSATSHSLSKYNLQNPIQQYQQQQQNWLNANDFHWFQSKSIGASILVHTYTHTHTYWLVQAHSNIEPSMQNHHIGLISWTFCGLL